MKLLAWLIALAWLWKAITAARGLPRITNLLEPQFDLEPAGAPSIVVIVPARNEEQALPAALASLLAQDYNNLRIIAVDDRSTDRTAAILDTLAAQNPARLRALHVKELPHGWLGKPHAMALAARHAIAVDQPDYLLFTDADVLFTPQAIRRSLAQAVITNADHFVTFPTPIVKTIGEGVLLGYLGVMGLWAARPWKISDPKAVRDSIGIGAFNLLRTSAYQQLGGFDALRMEILEDLTLAHRVKLANLRQRVAFAPRMVSLHWAAGAIGVVNVMTKNLFAVFRFRIIFVLAACLGLTALCLGPFLFLIATSTRFAAVLAIISIAALYAVSKRHSKISVWYALSFPAGALLFFYSLLRSAFITLREGGITWRGTFYSLAELRNNRSSKKI
ncbi:glycosyltransferase [Edaphobacter aggregans]|uniref:glycosyltransferase n=1 Tax=Edaphobacter aggregans TaxID=570835 RepID=UPI000558A8ED|nr:glycosyltransferase [Edaphobacter aggregans]